jgi:murein L,D-transpeptidase YcbB/YkuD
MRIKILVGVVLVLFLSGCATTKKGQDTEVQQLKSRVSSLEAELQTREQEIDRLEGDLEKAREKRLSLREEKKEVREISTKQIQMALKKAGFYKGLIDGKIGPATNEAIKAFQRTNGLKADGIVGRKTKAKMMEYLTD